MNGSTHFIQSMGKIPALYRRLQLIQTIELYFTAKQRLKALEGILEKARQTRGETTAAFYDLRRNPSFSEQILQFFELKNQVDCLLIEAEKLVEIPQTASDDVCTTKSAKSLTGESQIIDRR